MSCLRLSRIQKSNLSESEPWPKHSVASLPQWEDTPKRETSLCEMRINFSIAKFWLRGCLNLQRICDDVPYFVDGSTDLMLGIARKLFGVIAFSGRFWEVFSIAVRFLTCFCWSHDSSQITKVQSSRPVPVEPIVTAIDLLVWYHENNDSHE